MEGQGISKLAAKLITRSKAKVSVGHRKLVNYLDNISRDETGAPVRWSYNKNSKKLAKGISKKLARAETVDKSVKRLKTKPKKMMDNVEPKHSSSAEVVKKKNTVVKKGKDAFTKKPMKPDSLIISIRRLDDSKASASGATERIVTFGNSNEEEQVQKKRGRKPKLKGITATQGKGTSSQTIQPEENGNQNQQESSANQDDQEHQKEALKNLEQEIAIKRGRSNSASWTSLNQKVIRRGLMDKVKLKGESKSRDSSEGRMDSDLESVDSNLSGASDRKKRSYKKSGILLGPRKLLRSQDTLITRGKKTENQSGIKRRKRTLSGEFDLLDEVSLKRKLRKEQEDDGDETDTPDQVENENSDGTLINMSANSQEDEANSSRNTADVLAVMSKTHEGTSVIPKPKGKPGRPRKKPRLSESERPANEATAEELRVQDENKVDSSKNCSSRGKIIRGRGRRRGRILDRPAFKFFGQTYKHVEQQKNHTKLIRGQKHGRSRGRGFFKSAFRKNNSSDQISASLQMLDKMDSVHNESKDNVSADTKKVKKTVFKFGSLTIIGPGSYEINTQNSDSNQSEDSSSSEMPVLEESPRVSEMKETYDNHNKSELTPSNVDDVSQYGKERQPFSTLDISTHIDEAKPTVPLETTDSVERKIGNNISTSSALSSSAFSSVDEKSGNIEEKKDIKEIEPDNANLMEEATTTTEESCVVEKRNYDKFICEEQVEKTTDIAEGNISFIESEEKRCKTDVDESVLVGSFPKIIESNVMDNAVSSSDSLIVESANKRLRDSQVSDPSVQHRDAMVVKSNMDNEEPLSTRIEDNELPGIYFRETRTESGKDKIKNDSVLEDNQVENNHLNQEDSSEFPCENEEAQLNSSSMDMEAYEDVISVQVTVCDKDSDGEGDKDENSRSSESSLDHSTSSISSLKGELPSAGEDTTPENKPKRSYTKRESKSTRTFQLRQKASRSPLEIIAMRQSQEEKQYLLEQSQKAMKREEKQKKKQMRGKLENDTEMGEISVESSDTDSLFKTGEENTLVKGQDEDSSDSLLQQCKPCSVVLIDFVKYLKMNESAQGNEGDSCTEEEESSEEPSNVQASTVQELLPEEREQGLEGEGSLAIVGKDDEKAGFIPLRKKRKPSARKQARTYNFKQNFTAEIVNYPLQNFDYDPSATVPPLRLKIKANLEPEPKKRGRTGKRKARKSFSPAKTPSKIHLKNQEKRNSAETTEIGDRQRKSPEISDTQKKPFEMPTEGFEGSYVQFISQKETFALDRKTRTSTPRKSPEIPKENKVSPVSPVIERKQIKEKISPAVRKEGKLRGKGDSSEMKYECTFNNCGFQASQRDEIKSHIYVHLKNTPFKCLHCTQVYKTRTEAFLHSRSEHHRMDVMIEPAEFVDETQYFKQINGPDHSSVQVPAFLPASSSPSKQTVQAEVHQVEQSPDSVIIKVVLPGNVHQPKGCYCCSYCDFSSSVQQEILNHINENHRLDIQYTCSLCNKTFLGNKEGIASHFAHEHPNQPILYKSMPEFYEVGKSLPQATATVTTVADKDNIFDRMSDLFSPQEQQVNRGKRMIPDSTSAEADSTTAEGDLMQTSDPSTRHSDQHSSKNLDSGEKMDGIEELGKTYAEQNRESNEREEDSPEKDAQDDIGLKIVDVVSLCNQEGSVWNDSPQGSVNNTGSAPRIGSPSMTSTKANTVPQQSPADAITALRGHLLTSSAQQQSSENETASQQTPAPQAKGKSDLKICTTYKCEKCNVHAPVLASMVEHLRISHKDIEKLFLCPYCRQYEGATEPDIHRHIKQFHQQNMQQKSPPVALSSAAKQHLRTIQVPAGDANKIGDKYVIEKDIYKCLKCNGHMPSLDFIYNHLEKQHNEFFVNVCPYCKVFKSKDEEVVFNHIRQVHNRSTDITLSVAIEENLFTRVQCLVKSKPIPPKSTNVSSSANNSVVNSNSLSKVSMPTIMTSLQSAILSRPQLPTHSVIRPNIPMVPQAQPIRFPFQAQMIQQPMVPFTQIPSKSSLRKSRPQHRDKGMPISPGLDQSLMEIRRMSMSPRSEASGAPPPLLRAPPPLIRFQNSQLLQAANMQNIGVARPVVADSSVLGNTYTMSERMQTLHACGRAISPQQISSHSESEVAASGRPVLRVPSVRSSSASSPPARPPPPPYDVARFQNSRPSREDSGTPLNLSKLDSSTEKSRPAGENEQDDMPPDAFQIFNIRPGAQSNPEETANYNQFQVRPNKDIPRQRYPMTQSMLRGPRPINPPGAMFTGFDNPLRPFTPRSNTLRSPEGETSIDRRVFKCPYCTRVVPLNMGEVAPHIEKFHPGHSIVFSKLDG